MISKADCMLLLTDLEDAGLDVSDAVNELIESDGVTFGVLRFINSSRQLDLSKFYEKIRKSYNNKKSTLYINVVKEVEDVQEVLTTLSAMLTQILLFAKSVEDREMFLSHARAYEISGVLANYFKYYDLTPCIKLLRVIKTDLKVLESFNER